LASHLEYLDYQRTWLYDYCTSLWISFLSISKIKTFISFCYRYPFGNGGILAVKLVAMSFLSEFASLEINLEFLGPEVLMDKHLRQG